MSGRILICRGKRLTSAFVVIADDGNAKLLRPVSVTLVHVVMPTIAKSEPEFKVVSEPAPLKTATPKRQTATPKIAKTRSVGYGSCACHGMHRYAVIATGGDMRDEERRLKRRVSARKRSEGHGGSTRRGDPSSWKNSRRTQYK